MADADGDGKRTVALILLTLDQKANTIRCLESLEQYARQASVMLWDNGSMDGTADEVARRFPWVLVHRHDQNLGVAGGRNAAARLAIGTFSPQYLFFLDNDVVATSGFLQAMQAPFETDPRVGQTAPKLRMLSDPDRIDVAGGSRVAFWRAGTEPVGHSELDRGQYDEPGPCLPAGCMMVRTELFERLGGFDLAFNPYGPEDLDFSLRSRRAGYRAVYVPEALLYHDRSQTFERGRYTERYAKNKARVLWTFVRRHGSFTEVLAFVLFGAPLRLTALILREGSRRNFGAIRGALSGAFASSPRGPSARRRAS